MTIQEVRSLAKSKGVKTVNTMKKAEIIRTIQRAEGNFDCFGRASSGFCDQAECSWKEDCFAVSALS